MGLRKEHVKEEFLRGSGRGGQAVNKTANKVRVTHLPTGVQAVSQQERERSKNRFIALRSLVAKLEAPGQIKDEGEKRRGQIRKLKAKVTTFPVPRESLSPSLPFSLPFFLSRSLSPFLFPSLSLALAFSRARARSCCALHFVHCACRERPPSWRRRRKREETRVTLYSATPRAGEETAPGSSRWVKLIFLSGQAEASASIGPHYYRMDIVSE